MAEGIRGDRVRALREARGWTQYELAYRCHIAVSFLSDIERGQGNPGSVIVAKLADALETSTDYLLGRTDDPRSVNAVHVGDSNGAMVPVASREEVIHWFRARGIRPADAELLADMYERLRRLGGEEASQR